MRSRFEREISKELKAKLGARNVKYEVDRLPYTVPEEVHHYKPDFRIRPKVYIETKGLFTAADRKKMLLVKEQHPDKKFYILFYKRNGNRPIYPRSKTTNGDWCTANGFEWANASDGIPEAWLATTK